MTDTAPKAKTLSTSNISEGQTWEYAVLKTRKYTIQMRQKVDLEAPADRIYHKQNQKHRGPLSIIK